MSLPDISFQISADAVAWYGAIVATLTVLVSIHNSWRDRARIKIKFEPNMCVVGMGSSYPEDVHHLSISAVNMGRRPIRITQAGVQEAGRKGYLVLADSFISHRPQVITEESPTTTFFVRQDLFNLKKVYRVTILDGTGRKYIKYTTPFPTFRRLRYWLEEKLRKNISL